MDKFKKNKLYSIFSVVFVTLLVAILVPLTLAYLTDIFEDSDTGTVGAVGLAIYTDNATTLIASSATTGDEGMTDNDFYTLTLGAESVPQDIDLWVKNTGNIDGLIKITVALSFAPLSQDDNAGILTTLDATFENNGWANKYVYENSNPAIPQTLFIETFYNSKATAGQTIKIADTITNLLPANNGRVVEFSIQAHIVTYSGNAYKTNDETKPFGNLSADFLQNTWTAWK